MLCSGAIKMYSSKHKINDYLHARLSEVLENVIDIALHGKTAIAKEQKICILEHYFSHFYRSYLWAKAFSPSPQLSS
jgi:hypothetical protein